PTECANYFRNSRYAQSQKHHALVFVRLAHDRRLVAAVLFVLSSSSSSSSLGSRGGIVLPMITKGLLSINLVKNSSGMCGVMLLLLGCGELGFGPSDAHAVIPGGWNGGFDSPPALGPLLLPKRGAWRLRPYRVPSCLIA